MTTRPATRPDTDAGTADRAWWDVALADVGGPAPLPADASTTSSGAGPDTSALTATLEVTDATSVDPVGLLLAAAVTRYGLGGPAVVTVGAHGCWLPVVVDLSDFPVRDEAAGRWDRARELAHEHRADAPAVAGDATATAEPGPLGQVVVSVDGTPWTGAVRPHLAARAADGRIELSGRGSIVRAVVRHLRELDGGWRGAVTLDAAPMLGADERASLVAAGRGLVRSVPRATVWDLIRDRAAADPAAPALVADDGRLDYAELVRRVDLVAARLREVGVGRGALVGLCTDRTTGMVVGLLGVLAAGAAYVPIDLGYPADRVAMMVEDARITVAVTERAMVPRLPTDLTTTVVVDDLVGAPPATAAADPGAVSAPGPGPEDVAYVIFTSGSTGRPKGVVIGHGALTNFVGAIAAEPGIAARDRLLAVTTLSFDIAGLELLVPLVVGGCVVVAGRSTVVDPAALAAVIEREAVTVVQATPATWQMLVDAGWSARAGLRVLCGGEALPEALAARLGSTCDLVWNLYGPTETTIWSLAVRLRPGDPVTIGRPIANTDVLVVGRRQELLPAGVAGELLIGGSGVAHGYLGRPDLTAERFLDDVAAAGGGRYYRTGDLVRRLPDGRLEFLGRMDNQVKVRGFRVELGEVEAALGTHPGVARAVVVVRPDERTGSNRLLGYVVFRAGVDVSPAQVRDHATAVLPAYMVPAVVTVLPAFPLTPNAKVDRRALPEPVIAAREVVAARTDLERSLVTIWQEVLGLDPIGITDDVFDLGASSLTTARLFVETARRLSVSLPVAAVFEAPTIEKLARRLGGADARTGPGTTGRALVPIRVAGLRPPVFLVHGGAGTVLLYEPLARLLPAEVPVYALQAIGLYGDAAPQWSVKQMARAYVEEMREVSPSGPYRIGGYCFGALVAFEMARQLTAAGEHTELLVTVNGPSPRYIARYHPAFDAQGARTDEFGRPLRRGDPAGGAAPPRSLRRTARSRWRSLRRRAGLVRLVAARHPLPEALREFGGFQQLAAFAQAVYRPRRWAGDMVVVRSDELYREDDLGWSHHVDGRIEVVSSGSQQITPRQAMTEQFVLPVVTALTDRLDRLDGTGRR